MFYRLPPVYQPVITGLSANEAGQEPQFPPDCTANYYQSGTAALAAVLSAVRLAHETSDPEIIMPGYTCPDVISAAIHAKIKPVLVDFVPDRPWLDIDEVNAAITNNTVAIIAINFLGIPERLNSLRDLADKHRLFLIEDSAQAFPLEDDKIFISDARIHSFGRGKPINLLGGGLALVCNSNLQDHLIPGGISRKQIIQRLIFLVKAGIFNHITLPRIYWMIENLPFLHIGETQYKTLNKVEYISEPQKWLMPNNIKYYKNNVGSRIKLSHKYNIFFNSMQNRYIDIARYCDHKDNIPLLRYPILCGNLQEREVLFSRLDYAGCGASRLYGTTLTLVQNIPTSKFMIKSDLNNATSFSNRLLTLPLHFMAAKRIKKIIEIIARHTTEQYY